MKNVIIIYFFPFLICAQVSLVSDVIPPQVSLDLGVSDKVLTLPAVYNANLIQNPQSAMLVYDEYEDGVLGYLKYNEANYRWSSLFLTTDALLLKNSKQSLTSYTRSASTADNTYVYIPSLDTNFTTVSSGRLAIIQFETKMKFSTRCFRGKIKINVEDSLGIVVATTENLFNYGGVTGVNSTFPYNLNLKFIGKANVPYKVKIYQDPTTGVCKNEGTFENTSIEVNYY